MEISTKKNKIVRKSIQTELYREDAGSFESDVREFNRLNPKYKTILNNLTNHLELLRRYPRTSPDNLSEEQKFQTLKLRTQNMVKHLHRQLDNDPAAGDLLRDMDSLYNSVTFAKFNDRIMENASRSGVNVPRVTAMNAGTDLSDELETGYENVPDSLMGYASDGNQQKAYNEQKYPYNLNFYYSVDSGKTWNQDTIKGMNRKHAIERLKRDFFGRNDSYENHPEYRIRLLDNTRPDGTNGKKSIRRSQQSLDAEYMKAVKANDMETAQRMVDEAAENAGYKIVAYHGTEAQFNVFDRTKSRSNMDIQGNFFSPWEIDAGGYGRNLRKFYIKLNNPATFGQGLKALKMFQGLNKAGEKAANYLIKKGYDGVNNDDEEYIVFNSENIKSADPVTYDDNGNIIPLSQRFDTENKDIRYSIKSKTQYLPKKSLEFGC